MYFLGFPDKWHSWIRACLVSAISFVLNNDSATQEFNLERGLRQSDPLSPFLFIIAMDGLHIILEDAVANGLFRAAKLRNLGIQVSHLFYVDDVLFMGEWDAKNITNLIRVIKCIYMMSGLQLNLSKSNLVGVGVESQTCEALSNLTGCNSTSLPFVYLGLPIGENMNQVAGWRVIVD